MSASLDTRFTAETPEGIALALRPAGVVARFYAFAIDGLIRMGIILVASIALQGFGGLGAGFTLIAWFAIEWFYPVVFELTLAGAHVLMKSGEIPIEIQGRGNGGNGLLFKL